MDLILSKTKGQVVICLKPNEVDDGLILLKALLEVEDWEGKPVPVLGEVFFEQYSPSSDKSAIVLGMKYFHIAVYFIQEVVRIMAETGEEANACSNFLTQMEEWHQSVHALQ